MSNLLTNNTINLAGIGITVIGLQASVGKNDEQTMLRWQLCTTTNAKAKFLQLNVSADSLQHISHVTWIFRVLCAVSVCTYVHIQV